MVRAASTSLLPTRVARPQVPTGMLGSAAYSFGKPRHRKGTFKIPVLDARSPEYIPGMTPGSGPGAYDIHDTLARHDTKYGHPLCKKAPSFSWSGQTEPRDVITTQFASRSDNATTTNRYSHLAHVRSDSCLDVPGPGAYLGLNEMGLEHKMPGKSQANMPSYTMRPKCAKIDNNPRRPPFPGPFEYETGHKQKVLNRRQPAFIIPKMKRVSEALLPACGTTDHVGPGKYDHAISLHSKFPIEEGRHRCPGTINDSF